MPSLPSRGRPDPWVTWAHRRHSILHPLDLICERNGVELPQVTPVAPAQIPSPCRELLVHRCGMTRALERYWNVDVGVRLLSSFVIGNWYYRRILLINARSGRPVETAAMRTRLDRLSNSGRRNVLAGHIPFGHILRQAGIVFRSCPRVFLEVKPSSQLLGLFWMHRPLLIYGRQAELISHGSSIGEVLEILPPVRIGTERPSSIGGRGS